MWFNQIWLPALEFTFLVRVLLDAQLLHGLVGGFKITGYHNITLIVVGANTFLILNNVILLRQHRVLLVRLHVAARVLELLQDEARRIAAAHNIVLVHRFGLRKYAVGGEEAC